MTRELIPSYLAATQGARLIDLRVDVDELCIALDAPGMSVGGLELATSLSRFQGHTYTALRRIAADLVAEVRCGHKPDQEVLVQVSSSELGPYLEIGVGPAAMYTSVLNLRTRSGQTLRKLLDETFAAESDVPDQPGGYIACLNVVAGPGHRHAHGVHDGPAGQVPDDTHHRHE